MKKKSIRFLFTLILVFSINNGFSQYLSWAYGTGGLGSNSGKCISLFNNNDIYMTGYFNGTIDIDPSLGVCNLTSNYYASSFLVKYNTTGSFNWAFMLGAYDNTSKVYNTSVVNDTEGNVYIAGYFAGTVDFDPGSGSQIFTSNGNFDYYIAKYDSAGNYIWAFSIGGLSTDMIHSMCIDNSNNLYVFGITSENTDIDPDTSVFINYDTGISPYYQEFIAKYNENGNFIWGKNFPGRFYNDASSIKVDKRNNIVITGQLLQNGDFDPGPDTCLLSSYGSYDIFISKFDSSGNFIFAENMGSSGYDAGLSMAFDEANNIYIIGLFNDTVDFDPDTSSFFLSSCGDNDIFIAKYDSIGRFLNAFSIGGAGLDIGYAITLDPLENIYVTGCFHDTTDFDPSMNNYELIALAGADIFLAKYNNNNQLKWAIGVGSQSGFYIGDISHSLLCDLSDNVYISGYYSSYADFDPSYDTLFLETNGCSGLFIAKYSNEPTYNNVVKENNDITIYPNPTTGKITIKAEDMQNVEIIDLQGKQIYTGKENQIDLSNQPKGIYIIKVITDKQTITRKLIKQ